MKSEFSVASFLHPARDHARPWMMFARIRRALAGYMGSDFRGYRQYEASSARWNGEVLWQSEAAFDDFRQKIDDPFVWLEHDGYSGRFHDRRFKCSPVELQDRAMGDWRRLDFFAHAEKSFPWWEANWDLTTFAAERTWAEVDPELGFVYTRDDAKKRVPDVVDLGSKGLPRYFTEWTYFGSSRLTPPVRARLEGLTTCRVEPLGRGLVVKVVDSAVGRVTAKIRDQIRGLSAEHEVRYLDGVPFSFMFRGGR